jgi:hypothetical protein
LSDEGLKALERELRAPAPAGVRRLGDAELLDLATAITDERHRQTAALAAAGEAAFGQLPRLIRIPLRKVLGG